MKIARFSADLKDFTKEKFVQFFVILEKSVTKTYFLQIWDDKLQIDRSQRLLGVER